ncbi:putative disease resistance RPP13-like protein 1 [Vitis vinifera]|uniref:Putative disease resistance RPP13-like protein 1 n=1 Tax=Vitis vinifera TaxID=29760 RepID=A0A438D3D9_VITVI|nr:putative disease resistance RPP13-like protein 1 [Vitis vinifera]
MAGAVAGGGALLSASLKVLLNRMDSPEVRTFLRGQKLSATLRRELKMKLLAVKAVLNDADAKQITNSDVKDWMDELKDAVYDAEDLVDDITTEALRCKMESDSQSQVRNIIFGEGIESRVEEITDTLEYLAQKKDVLGLKEGVGENLSKRWPTTSLVDESGVYGRDADKEKIVESLLFHNASGNKIGVIALVGMGGIGKTTLTQLVYNDRRVVEYFDLKAWVCVSDEFDLVRITKTILMAFDSGTSGKSPDDDDLNLLQLKLKERLSRKKFLLVLDDVWNEDYNIWDLLRTPFSVGLNGSKIIVTTRIKKVAAVMHSAPIHPLGQLSFEDCWSLFAKHAFENGDSSSHPKLEEIGKEIVKKCDGLPLAAKTLGGALYSEVRVKEWENVLNSEMWDLPNNAILPPLFLSYYYLPSHLKRCFAYCSIFPQDYQFDKENLILLWMAEGFLQQSKKGKKTMEEVGDGYFYDLLSRSFFQKFGSHKSYFVMHDLISDLARFVSGKVCVHLNDDKINEIPEKLRHLSNFRGGYDSFERFDTLSEVHCLRTFLPLDLRTRHRFDKVSKSRNPVKSGRHSRVKEMPSQMGQLKILEKLSNYRVGKQSGTRVGELRELSHIGGSLVIQELQNVVDAKDASEANLVGKQRLDELELEWNRDSDVEQNGAYIVLNNLQPHSNLKRLTIHRYGGSKFPDWLGGPSILNMVSLRLWNCKNVSTFPPLGQLPSLKHLYILGLGEIERVGAEFYGTEPSFVSLKALSFQDMPVWKEWLCLGGQGGEFPRLKELYIKNCPKLTGDLPNHLPLLTKLEIEECEQLVAPLPRVPAIRVLTTRSCDISQWKELPPLLRSLSITNSDSAESLLEEGMLQSNACLEVLSIKKCSFSRPLCRICSPIELKSLAIYECKKLEFLLPEFFKCHHPSIEYLNIYGGTCNSLSFNIRLGKFPRLARIQIWGLEGLESLSISISGGDLTTFDLLNLGRCPNLVSIELPALNISQYSIFGCENLKWLLHNAACFQSLTLQDCPELIFPIQGLPSDLTSLSIKNCDKLTSQVEWGLQGLPSLTSLTISGLPNLMSLDGMGLQLLTSLRKLQICDGPKLQSLTEERLPSSLSFLTIRDCPLLKDRCKFWTGEDWHLIAHIPHIVIDDQVL